MDIFLLDTSPFAILWLLFLVFFVTVIFVNLVSMLIAWIIDRQTNSLRRKFDTQVPATIVIAKKGKR